MGHMANSGLLVFGILIIVGIFLFTQIMITPQQRQQIELANKMCGASFLGIPIGQMGQSLSPNGAEMCRQVGIYSKIFSLSPIAYIIGFILIVAGLASGGKSKEIIKEVIREPMIIEKHIEKEEKRGETEEKNTTVKKEKVSKIKYCPDCGSRVKGRFCPNCGKKVNS